MLYVNFLSKFFQITPQGIYFILRFNVITKYSFYPLKCTSLQHVANILVPQQSHPSKIASTLLGCLLLRNINVSLVDTKEITKLVPVQCGHPGTNTSLTMLKWLQRDMSAMFMTQRTV